MALTAMMLTLGFAGVEDGIVLCFGGDGHVEIEVVGPVGCIEAAEAATPGLISIAPPASSSHCGPCVDVALTSSSAAEGTQAAKRGPAALAAVAIAGLRPPVGNLRASVTYPHTRRFISEKPHTVVIRC